MKETLYLISCLNLRKINPKCIIIENVPGILKLYNGKAKKEILELCESHGYNCNPKLIYVQIMEFRK